MLLNLSTGDDKLNGLFIFISAFLLSAHCWTADDAAQKRGLHDGGRCCHLAFQSCRNPSKW